MNLYFEPAHLGGSKSGILNLRFTDMLEQGSQPLAHKNSPGEWDQRQWDISLTDSPPAGVGWGREPAWSLP